MLRWRDGKQHTLTQIGRLLGLTQQTTSARLKRIDEAYAASERVHNRGPGVPS
jgi:DNA-binding MarR family transcriptional regulator